MQTLDHPNAMRRQSGVTLIELLIVIVILALATSGLGVGFNALTRSYLRGACLKVIAASRFAYNRAIIRGVTVRILFDFEQGTYSIEESERRVLLAKAQELKTLSASEKSNISEGLVDPWQRAEARLNKTFKPEKAISSFQPLRSSAGKVLERYQKQSLGNGIRVTKLITPHDPDAVTKGQAAIYFFPAGLTEPAVIQLKDGSDTVYSVELSGLSAAGKVHPEAFQPRAIDDVEDTEGLRDNG